MSVNTPSVGTGQCRICWVALACITLSGDSGGTLATRRRHPPHLLSCLPLLERHKAGVRGRDEGGCEPFSPSSRPLPAVECLVGFRLWAASSLVLAMDPWPGRSDLGYWRTDLAKPLAEEWQRWLRPSNGLQCVAAATPSVGCGHFVQGHSQPPWQRCGVPWADAIGHLGGGERWGDFRWWLPRQKARGTRHHRHLLQQGTTSLLKPLFVVMVMVGVDGGVGAVLRERGQVMVDVGGWRSRQLFVVAGRGPGADGRMVAVLGGAALPVSPSTWWL
jgi:hypothetical protein